MTTTWANSMASIMSEADFVAAWRKDLAEGVLGVQLVEVDHPIEIYVGASPLGEPRMQFRSAAKPKLPALSDLVLADRRQLGGGWLLTLTLQDPQFSDVFVRLAAHAVSRSRSETAEESAWRAVDRVFDEWRRLLRPRAAGVMTIDELRGLVGELWLVLEVFGQERPIDQAIAGWLGPLGSPQDFWYEESGFHEAKSVGPSAKNIRISSAEQLDQTELELIVLRVPQVGETTDGALNLPELLGRVADALNGVAVSHDELELRIARLGVQTSHPFYAEQWFKVVEISRYSVAAGFPAIRASELNEGLENVSYSIALNAVGSFKIITKTVQ